MRISIVAVAGLLCALFQTNASLRANDVSPPISMVSYNSEMTSLMAELNEMRAELDVLKASNLGGGKKSTHCCSCCCPCGWFAGAEVAVVKPHAGQGTPILMGQQLDSEFDYYATPRVNVGFRGPRGLGIRVRYWDFDQDSDVFSFTEQMTTFTSAAELDTKALDLEATKAFYICGVHWDLGAGVRYGKVDFTGVGVINDVIVQNMLIDIEGIYNLDFEGIGPTFSLEGRHAIGQTNLAVVGNLRASLLFGNQQFSANQTVRTGQRVVTRGVTGEFENKSVPVLESQVGIEWGVPFGYGRLSARAMLEGQWWGTAVGGAEGLFDPTTEELDLPTSDDDLAFFGGTFGINYNW